MQRPGTPHFKKKRLEDNGGILDPTLLISKDCVISEVSGSSPKKKELSMSSLTPGQPGPMT